MTVKENIELIRLSWKTMCDARGDAGRIKSAYIKFYAPDIVFHHLGREDMTLEQRITFMIPWLTVPELLFEKKELIQGLRCYLVDY